MNEIYRREIGLYSFLDHLDISINHRVLLHKNFAREQKKFVSKIFRSRNIQIRLRPDPIFKKN